RERLRAISTTGLRAQSQSVWANYAANRHLAHWSVGKIFLAPHLPDALYYARMSANLTGGHPAILRIPSSVVVDPQPDTRGWGSADVFTLHPISPESIEVLTSACWLPLQRRADPRRRAA